MNTGQRPSLSICIIVRDNESIIRACLESVRRVADELIVVDTGSVDATPQIAKELGAKVFFFPWCDDFSAARNESLRHATGDWIFWMDSDDTMDAENGRKLRELVARAPRDSHTAYVMQVHCPPPPGSPDASLTVVDHVKLFRNDPRIRFTGRIHEQVLPGIRALGGTVGWTDIFVLHSGSDQSEDGKKRKYERDLRLLRLELEENPDHPFVLFNFGMTYNDMGQHDEAIRWLQRSISVSHAQESHLRKAYTLLAGSLHALCRFCEADAVCREGLNLFPGDVELHFRRAMTAHTEQRWHEAVREYRNVLESQSERHFTSIDRSLRGYKTHHNLALVYQDLGEHAAAERHFRIVLREVPAFRSSWRGLFESLLRQRREVTALVELDQMRRLPQLQPEALLQQAQLQIRQGQRDEPLTLIRQACTQFPDDLDVLQTACRICFEMDAMSDTQQWLERLVELQPGDAAARHNLGHVQLRRGRPAEALHHLQRSLQMRSDSPATRDLLVRAQRATAQSRWLPFRRKTPIVPQKTG